MGADAIVLSRVIHDWGDEEALRILETCRRALSAGDRLLLVEATLPERAADDPAAIRMDLHMLLLLPGRERTEAEYRVLLELSGFRWQSTVPTSAGVAVLEAAAS